MRGMLWSMRISQCFVHRYAKQQESIQGKIQNLEAQARLRNHAYHTLISLEQIDALQNVASAKQLVSAMKTTKAAMDQNKADVDEIQNTMDDIQEHVRTRVATSYTLATHHAGARCRRDHAGTVAAHHRPAVRRGTCIVVHEPTYADRAQDELLAELEGLEQEDVDAQYGVIRL